MYSNRIILFAMFSILPLQLLLTEAVADDDPSKTQPQTISRASLGIKEGVILHDPYILIWYWELPTIDHRESPRQINVLQEWKTYIESAGVPAKLLSFTARHLIRNPRGPDGPLPGTASFALQLRDVVMTKSHRQEDWGHHIPFVINNQQDVDHFLAVVKSIPKATPVPVTPVPAPRLPESDSRDQADNQATNGIWSWLTWWPIWVVIGGLIAVVVVISIAARSAAQGNSGASSGLPWLTVGEEEARLLALAIEREQRLAALEQLHGWDAVWRPQRQYPPGGLQQHSSYRRDDEDDNDDTDFYDHRGNPWPDWEDIMDTGGDPED